MASPYKPVSWGNEYISSDKLNIMTSNDQYLYEKTPTVYYRAYGVYKKNGGMKILAGVLVFQPNKKVNSMSRDYHFGSFFSQGCMPIVTTGMSLTSGGAYHIVARGLGGRTIAPDYRGMNLRVISNSRTKDNSVKYKSMVNFHAVGW